MNVLITNLQLTRPSGTVSYVNDLAKSLKKKGHNVEVYTCVIGIIGHNLKDAGINVVRNLNHLKNIPDIIHAHHRPPAIDVIRRFNNTPVIFFVHDRFSPFDKPPLHKQILRYIAVDHNCHERIIDDAKIPEHYTGIVYNWVDTDKFRVREYFSEKPLNAVVFSNYATPSNFYTAIKKACGEERLQLDVVGDGFDSSIIEPAEKLLKYDLVFAKAKAAMEALATGAAVILCDYRGLGEMVNSDNMCKLQKWNFGMKTLTRDFDAVLIKAEIKKFSSISNRENAGKIREISSFNDISLQLIDLYKEIIQEYKNGIRGPGGNLFSLRVQGAFLKIIYLYYYILSRMAVVKKKLLKKLK